MKKNISLFLFVLLSFVIRLSAQAQPVAHLSVDQSSILENGGSTKLVVTLRNTSGALANATSVTNATITFTGVAINGTDYTISNLTSSTSNIISIPVGASSGFLTITATDDNIIEPDEKILAEISSINVGTIDNINKDREIEILDDDLVVTLKLQAGDTFLLEEGSPKTRMRLQINQPASVDIEVQVGMTGGDAINADVNFTGVVKIDDGSTFNEFEIYAIDDNAYEDTETFYIKTTNIKSGPGKLAKDSIAFSIIDNDPPKVSFILDKDSIVEDGGVAKITITLSRPFGKDSKIAERWIY